MAEPAALEVRSLHKAYGTRAVLAGVDLTVHRGEIVAVLGPSGGGKTTLLRLVAGFDRPDSGTIAIAGDLVAGPGVDVPAERRRVGVVPQEGALFPHLDVAGNVGFGVPRGAGRAARVEEVLDLVGLPGMQRAKPSQLSGGQQHRVALARALAPDPSLVLLDEPFASLDAGLRAQVRDEVIDALQRANTTAVVVTHDQQEALSMADRVAVLLDGRVAQCADPATLYDEPADLAVATFVGEAVLLDGVVHDGRVHCALGELALRNRPANGPATVLVRPEQVELCDPEHGVPGTVLTRAFYGHDGAVRVSIEDGSIVAVRVHATRLPARRAAVGLRVVTPVSAYDRRGDTSAAWQPRALQG